MNLKQTLLLNKSQVGQLLNMKDTIAVVEDGYRAFSGGQVQQPDYMSIHQDAPRGEIDFKAGYCQGNESISIKCSSGAFAENPEKYGVPTGMGTILVFDGRTCALLCAMDGSLITGFRTGAAGAISCRLLARKDAKSAASIGTGNQARNQLRALQLTHPVEEVWAWDAVPAAMEQFKADMEGELGLTVHIAQSKQQAVENADIVITTTRGKGPLVEAAWVRPGTHIVAIGTDQPGKQELEPEIFRGAKVVNDSIDQCVAKGETQHPIAQGILRREDIHAEIGQILLGQKAGRENDTEITIFDSTGMAVQDNVTARRVYDNAVEQGVGTWFSFLE